MSGQGRVDKKVPIRNFLKLYWIPGGASRDAQRTQIRTSRRTGVHT